MIALENLTLRPLTANDAPTIAAILGDFEVTGKLARVPFPYGLADAEAFLASQARPSGDPEGNFAIDLPGSGLAGVIGVRFAPDKVILGYYLGRPWWGRGLMTEAASGLVDWFFHTTEWAALCSSAFAFNSASLRVQEKLGFVQTGHGMAHCLARGQDLGHIDTRLTRAAWLDRQART